MLEARDLRLVRSIEENRSLVRAARALGTTQPALTRSLAALEARLQGRLFERSRQGVIATDLGRAVLAEAADILERLDRVAEIPMAGLPHSLNAATSTAVAIYEYCRQFPAGGPPPGAAEPA